MNFATVAIVTKPQREEVAEVAIALMDWLTRRGLRAMVEEASAARLGRPESGLPEARLREEADLVVVVGGDGTLLAASRLLDGRDVPILAINHGSLGFLTAAPLEDLYPDLERTLAGEFTSDRRMMVDASILRNGERVASHKALNDVVVNKGVPARIIELEARVDGGYVSTYRADGLIVSTPTGSTAYNLSAGGPIVHPGLRALVMTPISSHTITNRPIVLPPEVRVTVRFDASDGDQVNATIDGQVAEPMEAGDVLEVTMSDAEVQLISPSDMTYFDVLRGKLKWG